MGGGLEQGRGCRWRGGKAREAPRDWGSAQLAQRGDLGGRQEWPPELMRAQAPRGGGTGGGAALSLSGARGHGDMGAPTGGPPAGTPQAPAPPPGKVWTMGSTSCQGASPGPTQRPLPCSAWRGDEGRTVARSQPEVRAWSPCRSEVKGLPARLEGLWSLGEKLR